MRGGGGGRVPPLKPTSSAHIDLVYAVCCQVTFSVLEGKGFNYVDFVKETRRTN